MAAKIDGSDNRLNEECKNRCLNSSPATSRNSSPLASPTMRKRRNLKQFKLNPKGHFSVEKFRFEKNSSPDQLIVGIEEQITDSNLNQFFIDPNKWNVLYKGIFNPLSSQGKLFKQSLERRRIQVENERKERERDFARKKRIRIMALKFVTHKPNDVMS